MVLTKRLLLGLAAAGAVAGGALVFRPAVSIAAAFGGGSAVLWNVHAARVEGAGTNIRCAGECRVYTAELDDYRTCPLRPGIQATYAACLTALNTACATTCKSNP
jgi:hypothetical protein